VVLAALGALVASIAFPRAAQGVRAPSGEEEGVAPGLKPAPGVILSEASAEPTFSVLPLKRSAEEVI